MSLRRSLTVVVLALWVLLGPVAMAFDGCASMGATCEAPCAASSCAVVAPTGGLIAPVPIAYLWAPAHGRLPATFFSALEPPPKSPLAAS